MKGHWCKQEVFNLCSLFLNQNQQYELHYFYRITPSEFYLQRF